MRYERSKGQKVEDFIMHKKALGREANLSTIKEDDIETLGLILGINDIKIREKLFEVKEGSPSAEYCRVAILHERAMEHEQHMGTGSAVKAMQASAYKQSKNQAHQSQANKKSGLCYNCNEQGHAVDKCPKPKDADRICKNMEEEIMRLSASNCSSNANQGSNSRGRGGYRGRGRGEKAINHIVVSNLGDTTPNIEVFLSQGRRNTKSVQMSALADTGAQSSVISFDVVERNKFWIDKRRQCQLSMCDENSRMKCLGTVTLQVTVEDVTMPVKAYVTDAMENKFFLSCNDMKRFGIIHKDFPKINNQIKQMVNAQEKCNGLLPSLPREMPKITTANRPFEAVSADLFEVAKKNYLVCVDRYSGYPLVARLAKTDTAAIIRQLRHWISSWGKVDSIWTDGGPQFGERFTQWCETKGIVHELSSAYHPQSNGHAENSVKSMKKLLQTKTSWEDFEEALLEWRNTPRTDGLSPAEWVFGRRQRTDVVAHPSAYKRISDEDFNKAELSREREVNRREEKESKAPKHPKFKVGDYVVTQDKQTGRWDHKWFVIGIRIKGRSYVLKEVGSSFETIRNRNKIRPMNQKSAK